MKVLLAEDEAVSRRLLEHYLVEWGHEVTVVPDGLAAWRSLEQEDFPIVISDWAMPKMDGIELVKRIRSSNRPTYVYTILLTARSKKDDVVAGMEAGADDFISKPFDRNELRVRLREGERIIRLERNLAEQNRALREAQVALVQSEKLAGLAQLAAGMAHEINNPLAIVSGNLAVLRRDVDDLSTLLDGHRRLRFELEHLAPTQTAVLARMEDELKLPDLLEELRPLLERSFEGLNRVRDIVRNLRDFSSLDEAEFMVLDVNAALMSAIGMLRHEADLKRVSISTHLEATRSSYGKPARANQVWFNVLLNAIQACRPDGRIEVRTRDASGALVAEIEDDGCGIKVEHVSRIFEPFFTTKPVGQGRGLGLAVSYAVVRDHGGSIEVESREGSGTTIRIRLPIGT